MNSVSPENHSRCQAKGDCCITSEIDVPALRHLKFSHRSPANGFKPVPDGFNQNIAHERKALPRGEQA